MRGHFNIAGANVAFTWRTGYPFAIDFSQGYPQYNPGEFTTIDLLKNNDIDATLVIGSDPGAHFPKVSMKKMLQHPIIVINPDMNATSMVGDVLFPTQWCGIEYEGTVYRMDTVPILLRKVVEPPPGVLNDEQILAKILAEVRAIKAKAETPYRKTKESAPEPQVTSLEEIQVKERTKRRRKA